VQTALQHRSNVGQSLAVQSLHDIDCVGGDSVVLHVKTDKHVMLVGLGHQGTNVVHPSRRIDEQTKGGGLDAQVGIKAVLMDGVKHTHVFVEEVLRFVHVGNFFTQHVDGETGPFRRQTLHDADRIVQVWSGDVATADPADEPFRHPHRHGDDRLGKPTDHDFVEPKPTFDPLCERSCLLKQRFDALGGQQGDAALLEMIANRLTLPPTKRFLVHGGHDVAARKCGLRRSNGLID